MMELYLLNVTDPETGERYVAGIYSTLKALGEHGVSVTDRRLSVSKMTLDRPAETRPRMRGATADFDLEPVRAIPDPKR